VLYAAFLIAIANKEWALALILAFVWFDKE
jgi:hypothetical protein